jgi:proteic killer suppression protein
MFSGIEYQGRKGVPGLIKGSIKKDLDNCHVIRDIYSVIKTFADKHTRDFYITGRSNRLQPDLLKRALRRLEYIDYAACLDDLRVPPSNCLHSLKGDRKGQYAISINDQWRICFSFRDGDAYEVEIVDYH